MATITFTPQQKQEYFHNALCNAVGTGYIEDFGIELKWSKKQYDEAKEKLYSGKNVEPCFEDILVEILEGGGELRIRDFEGGGSMNAKISMKDLHDNFDLLPDYIAIQLLEESDDATTAMGVIETVFYKEIIFG